MSTVQLKLILLFRSIPTNDIELRELLKNAGLIERFTPYVAGPPRATPERRSKRVAGEATKRGNRRTNFGGRYNRHVSGNSCRGGALERCTAGHEEEER
jgi:hypothetical protein